MSLLKEDTLRLLSEINYFNTLVQAEHNVLYLERQWQNLIYWQEVCRKTLTRDINA